MMDSWSYASEGKSYTFEEANSSFDSLAKSKNLLNHSSYYENNINILVENHDQVIGELGMIRNSNIEHVLRNKDGGDESSSKLSISSIVESSTRDSFSPLIDLKLGGFVVDHRNNVKHNFKSSTESSSTPPVKRFRSANMSAKNSFFCQVHGCNKDLSGSKDYHKRHKVCEAHSKTARVTVNGIEQRFCQQCSRFHLLDEFDDGKRSCRKRLAGHNERRRKPQIGIRSGRNGRLHQSYSGFARSMLNRATLTSGSLGGSQYITSNGLLHTEDYEQNDWFKRIKQEDILDFGPPLAIPITGRNLHSKPDYPNFQENGSMNSNSGRCPHDQSELNYGCRSLGGEDLTDFGTALSATGHALSLLSSQQVSSPSQSHSTRMPIDQHHGRYSGMSQISEENLMGVSSSQACINRVTTQFHSSRMNDILVSNGCNNAADFDIANETLQRSEFFNHKDHLFCDDAPSTTIDLLQLSTQLQRVECQRQSSTQGTGFLQMEE